MQKMCYLNSSAVPPPLGLTIPPPPVGFAEGGGGNSPHLESKGVKKPADGWCNFFTKLKRLEQNKFTLKLTLKFQLIILERLSVSISPALDHTRSISNEVEGMQCITLASLDNKV